MDGETRSAPNLGAWLIPAMVLATLALLLLPVGMRVREQLRLDDAIERAEAECARQEYVLHRDWELRQRVQALTDSIAQATARAEGRPAPPSTPPAAQAPRSPLPTPGPPTWNPLAQPQALEERRLRLDGLNQNIQEGLGIERRLPELERKVAALESQLQATEAKAAAGATPAP